MRWRSGGALPRRLLQVSSPVEGFFGGFLLQVDRISLSETSSSSVSVILAELES